MAFQRKETYDSDTPSDLSSRTSTNGALYRRSSKGTTFQSHRGPGSVSNSSVHNDASTAATRKDLFKRPGQGSLYSISHHSPESSSSHGNCPTISDHKSFHHLGKSTFAFRNQSPSTDGTETTWSYQAPISRPQEPISRHQEPVLLPQEPISRSQEPVSRPQATRSHTFDTIMTDIQIGPQSQRSPLAAQNVELTGSSVSISEHRVSL